MSRFDDSLLENDTDTSDTSSQSSYHSANDSVFPYDADIEPLANVEEAAQYAQQVAVEEEEEQILLARYSGEDNVEDW